VDRVHYHDNAPWPTSADGLGNSLQRVSMTGYGNDPTNWLAAAPAPGQPTTGTPPSILSQPASQVVACSAEASFTVLADGALPLIYQWYQASAPVANATNATLILSNVTVANESSYFVIAANAAGSATSQVATLTLVDTVAPVIGTMTATVGAADVKNCAVSVAANASVQISVSVSDACGLAAPPTVTLTNGASSATAPFVNESPAGTFHFAWTIGASAPGTWSALVTATDTGHNTASQGFTLCVLPLQIAGLVELEAFVGASRTVTFKATGATNNMLQIWNLALHFTNGVASYVLTNVPPATAHLSAKTAWHLRKRLDVTFASGVSTMNFIGSASLLGGDFDESNRADMADYFALATAWYTPAAAADIDGSGFVDLDDYFLLASHWSWEGDPE